MGTFVRVAVLRPVQRAFHYSVPDRLQPWVRAGVRCLVPFGRGRASAFVVALDEPSPGRKLKDLAEVLDPEPLLPPDLLSLGLWLSRYYHYPPGEALAALLPPTLRSDAEPVYGVPRGGALPDSSESPEALLWFRIRERGEVGVSSLAPSDLPLLDNLVKLRLVERRWRPRAFRGGGVEPCFALAPGAPDPDELPSRLSSQIEMLRALSAGPLPLSALRARGVTRDAVKRTSSKGWVEAVMGPEPDFSVATGTVAEGRLDLTADQVAALTEVVRGLDHRQFRTYLLHGMTGSGKTEVYLRAVEEARRRGLGAIVLVPEISLTPQLLKRFSSNFGAELAVLHSALGDAERRRQWERLRGGGASIAIGARSAVFAPVRDLGLIVVDEEHDPSYKQEEGLRYHAKHTALMRASGARAVVILGSATPDVETYRAAASGRYRRLLLPRRVLGAVLPEMRVVDLRQEEARRRSRVVISDPLRSAVSQALGRGEQALLFLNRRGFSPALVCPSCGAAVTCSRCSIALTLHRREGGRRLLCHYCDASRSVPAICTGCGSERLVPAGIGTQRLVEEAGQAWPGARIVRLDRDTALRGGGEKVLAAFHRGEGDILVGTQMVAKGHHFPRLTVVGVVDADLSLTFPDFRAAERTFQILTQVAGRAGREALSGLVYFQTRNPHNGVFSAVVDGDYERFAESELKVRRETGFPPFRRLALLCVSSPQEADGRELARYLAEAAGRVGGPAGVEVVGPAPAPLERIRGRHRFQVLLKAPGPEPGPLQAVLRNLLARKEIVPRRGVRLHADMDPVSML